MLVELDLDGTGRTDISTTVPFYDHMLTALGKHSLIDLTVKATGDTDIDAHHTVEDVAITIGQALRQALGDKRGISRFGDATVPLDEALAQAVVDVSGRPYLVHTGEPPGQEYHLIGGHFTGSLTRHVLESIAHHAAFSIHVRVLAGRDPHHIVEAQFKALARALRFAVERTRGWTASRRRRARCDVRRPARRLRGARRPVVAARRRHRGAVGRAAPDARSPQAAPMAATCVLAKVDADVVLTEVGRDRGAARAGRGPGGGRRRSRSCCARCRSCCWNGARARSRATRWIGGAQQGDDLPPGLVLSDAPAVLEDLLLGSVEIGVARRGRLHRRHVPVEGAAHDHRSGQAQEVGARTTDRCDRPSSRGPHAPGRARRGYLAGVPGPTVVVLDGRHG